MPSLTRWRAESPGTCPGLPDARAGPLLSCPCLPSCRLMYPGRAAVTTRPPSSKGPRRPAHVRAPHTNPVWARVVVALLSQPGGSRLLPWLLLARGHMPTVVKHGRKHAFNGLYAAEALHSSHGTAGRLGWPNCTDGRKAGARSQVTQTEPVTHRRSHDVGAPLHRSFTHNYLSMAAEDEQDDGKQCIS